jgi:hypothetical protein
MYGCIRDSRLKKSIENKNKFYIDLAKFSTVIAINDNFVAPDSKIRLTDLCFSGIAASL